MKKTAKKVISIFLVIMLILPVALFSVQAASVINITTGDSDFFDKDTWLEIDNDRVSWTCSAKTVKSYRYTVREMDINGNEKSTLLANRKFTTSKYFTLSSLSGIEAASIYKVWVGAFTDLDGNSGLEGDPGCIVYIRTVPEAPTVSTGSATKIGETYVTLSGEIEKNGGAEIEKCGFVISTSKTSLTLSSGDVYEIDGATGDIKGTFSKKISGLLSNKTYYFKFYATNDEGTSYGSRNSFKTTQTNVEISIKNTLSVSLYDEDGDPSPNVFIPVERVTDSAQVSWSTSNSDVARIVRGDEDGCYVTPVSVGTAVVTAEATIGSVSAKDTCTITVTEPDPDPDPGYEVLRTYTVSYDANGGSGAPSSQTKTINVDLTLSSVKPTKIYTVTLQANGGTADLESKDLNCTFNNWNTVKNGSGDSYLSEDIYTVNSNVTLYAQWTNPVYGELPVPTREGYVFDGWYTSMSGGEKVSETDVVTGSVVLYAIWQKEEPVGYTLTYDANGGSGAPSGESGASSYIVSYVQPVRSGYIFLGWATEKDATVARYVGGSTISSFDNFDVVLYAVWQRVYSISYDANGGIGAPSNQTKADNINLSLKSGVPIKTYTITYNANGGNAYTSSKTVECAFKNWNTKPNGSGTSYMPGTVYTDNNNVTLYAQWENPVYGELPVPTRQGYTFEGWYTAYTGGEKVTSENIATGNVTLYAHWSQIVAISCSIESLPAKTAYYYKENTSMNGFSVRIRYSDGTEKVVDDTRKMVFEGLNTQKPIGTKNVTVICEGCSTTFQITVKYTWWQWIIIILLFGWIWY